MRDAVILAAGNGDRFKNAHHHSKLLHPVLGQPLILRTLETAAAAGISYAHVVVGYEAERVRAAIEREVPRSLEVDFVFNPDWHLENGVSALAAEQICPAERFALLMGDHLFEAATLRKLAVHPVQPGRSVLAVDAGPVEPQIADEATRVRLQGDRIVAIGKGLEPWDAIDTGMFIFTPALFGALREAQREGLTTLSAGVQKLAARGLMCAAAIGSTAWCDVDTVDDLDAAETLFAGAQAEPV